MNTFYDYFQFNTMITTIIIRWLYGLGLLAIISTGGFMIGFFHDEKLQFKNSFIF